MKFSSTEDGGWARAPRGDGASASTWSWCDLSGNGASKARPGRSPKTAQEAEEARQAELKAAYQRGLADGRVEGEEQAREELRGVLSAVQGAVLKVRDAAEPWTKAARDNVLGLSLAVARRIVDRELDGDAETYGRLVRRALDRFPVDQEVRVRLHPADLALLSHPEADGSPLRIEGVRSVRWIPDQSVCPGDVILEGPDRVVDGSVDRALERIYRELHDD